MYSTSVKKDITADMIINQSHGPIITRANENYINVSLF